MTTDTLTETIEVIRAAQDRARLRARSRKQPRCEVCGKKPAISFSLFFTTNEQQIGRWLYTCGCTSNTEYYYVMLNEWKASEARRDSWVRHLEGKTQKYNMFGDDGFWACTARWLDAGGRVRP